MSGGSTGSPIRRKYYKNEQIRRDDKKERKEQHYINQNIKEYNVNKQTELLQFLFDTFRDQSKNNVKMLLTKRYIAVNGLCVTQYNYMLYKGDIVQISKVQFDKVKVKKDIQDKVYLDIIYEDDEFIVINKPSGLLSIESDTEKCTTAYKLVLQYMQSKDKNARCFQTHRIDKATSGVLMFTKDYKLNEQLKKSWNKIVTVRRYAAIVCGKPLKEQDTIVSYLAKDETNLMYTTKDTIHGEKAITHYKVKRVTSKYAYLDVNIDSGKKNQIRVAMNDMGCPIVGDDKYGDPTNPINRLGLHASELQFIHPNNGKTYIFKAPIPSEFRKLFS